MSNTRIEHSSDMFAQQDVSRAIGTDKHGGFHDFYATTYDEAYEGCLAEIEEANEE